MINPTNIRKTAARIDRPAFIILLWLAVQGLLYYQYGINTEGESIKYFREAESILNTGSFTSPKYLFYAAYIFLHILFKQLGIEIWGCYIFQCLLNIAALLTFFHVLKTRFQQSFIPLLITVYLVTLFPLQKFNNYLYTESIFISLSIFWTASLIYAKNILRRFYLPAILAILLLFTRPTGSYFVLITGLWLAITLLQQKKLLTAILLLAGGVVGSGLLLNAIMSSGGGFDFWIPYIEKHIICGVPTGTLNISRWEQQNLNIFYQVFIQSPAEVLTLMIQRGFYFWKITRAYYSPTHNILLMIWFYPIYLLAIFALIRMRKDRLIQLMLIAGIVFTVSVMLTCDDWMNRFILPLMPLLLVGAGTGIQLLRRKHPFRN